MLIPNLDIYKKAVNVCNRFNSPRIDAGTQTVLPYEISSR